MTLVVGITGGISSGKTAVSDRLADKGITIVDADTVARIVVEPGTQALNSIAEHFGKAVMNSDGTLDRAALRECVFKDNQQKNWLEKLLHPLIGNEIQRQLSVSSSPYTVMVSPLLVETTQSDMCDRVLVIDVPELVQIERACKRDKNTPDQIKRIIASQISREKRVNSADDVIDNTVAFEELDEKVNQLHRQYLKLASE